MARFLVTLESKQDIEIEIEKAVANTGLSKASIVRLGGYLLARMINNGSLEPIMRETLRELGEIKVGRRKR